MTRYLTRDRAAIARAVLAPLAAAAVLLPFRASWPNTNVALLLVVVVVAVAALGNRVAGGNRGSGAETERARIASPSQARPGQESLLAGWPVRRLWVLGLAASVIVAAIDAALGSRAILVGLLIVGPCCVVLTGRWAPTALTGVWVTGLAVALGVPDGIWGTAIFFIWLGAVAVVALVSTAAAAFIQALGPLRLR